MRKLKYAVSYHIELLEVENNDKEFRLKFCNYLGQIKSRKGLNMNNRT